MAAEMIARQVPISGRGARRIDGDREVRLHADRGGQHLPPHADEGGGGEAAGMAGDEPTQNHHLAAGPEGRHPAVLLLPADGFDDFGAAHQKVVHLVVDRVDLAAQIVECRLAAQHVRIERKKERY